MTIDACILQHAGTRLARVRRYLSTSTQERSIRHTLGDLLGDKCRGGGKDAEEGGDNGLHGSNLFFSTRVCHCLRRGSKRRRQSAYCSVLFVRRYSSYKSLVDTTVAIFSKNMSTSGFASTLQLPASALRLSMEPVDTVPGTWYFLVLVQGTRYDTGTR